MNVFDQLAQAGITAVTNSSGSVFVTPDNNEEVERILIEAGYEKRRGPTDDYYVLSE
jgi:hypothetical protein